MNITQIFQRVTTLSKERKDALLGKYGKGILSDAEKKELQEHILIAMAKMEREIKNAKDLFTSKDHDR